MEFDFRQVGRITETVEREGEAALSDADLEIYAAWTEYVEEAAPEMAPRISRVIDAFSRL